MLPAESLQLESPPGRRTAFFPDQPWPDTGGNLINAHGGGVLFHEGTYYWFGEHKGEGDTAEVGVHVYSSTDLYNWTDRGIALAVSDDADSEIARGCIIERPKVVSCRTTGQFVMWFHLGLKGRGRTSALSGLAVSRDPAGPYRFIGSHRPDARTWPWNVTAAQKAGLEEARQWAGTVFTGGPHPDRAKINFLARDFDGGQMAKDMTLFTDDDGTIYHVYSSEENSTLHISKLTRDGLSHEGMWGRYFEHLWHEAPALCRCHGKYWLLTSHCTGWNPNPARAAVADSIWGPWQELGNPCRGPKPPGRLGPEYTFGAQSAFILPVHGRKDAFIAMLDTWRPEDHTKSGYVWLPMIFEDDRFHLEWRNSWDLSVLD